MRIKDWNKFQHFKDRRPPWIKLHRETLDQRDIMMISSCHFRLLICLWMLASEDEEKEGRLPSIEDISFRIRMPEKEIAQLILGLTKWVLNVDIKAISERYQLGLPETETETYKPETEESPKKPKKTTPKQSDEEWIESIKTNPAYQGMNFDVEIGKAQAWCMTKGRKCSRQFLLNWFNRAEKVISLQGNNQQNYHPTFAQKEWENTMQAAREFVGGDQ